ncbi:class I SAM-dependent methyltransferase [Streptomonospora arabica]|uniref:Class I SAM-dependent methyltransferase n=1 Tax=Streptomonospora arabica TaxID=412417 RepID=A0ABV9SKE0_9ACTN
MEAQSWDEKYAGREQMFSGAPNAVLVAEAADLAPGQALDVGCGEGADALWLARRGWLVTAIDVSGVALQRAAAAGADVADRVAWRRGDLTTMPPPVGAFDLVSVQYVPLPRSPDHAALRGLLAAVAPGGTLLVGSHDLADLPERLEHGAAPGGYYQPADIARLLGSDWSVLVDEARPRNVPAPAGTHHTRDTVLRAQRLP